MSAAIVLIGPLAAGKTTIGRLLAARLGLPFCSLDELREAYYQQAGYDAAAAAQHAAEQGSWGLMQYSKPFEARMVELAAADCDGILDFGASNSIYEDSELFRRVDLAIASCPNVILLLPSPDPDESAAILKERLIQKLTAVGRSYSDELFELNEYFIQHPSNRRLAKRVVYTQNRTLGEICNEILSRLA